MAYDLNVSAVASLIADPTRAVMLGALLDGRALPAGELAYAAGVTAQTASSHLAKLMAGGFIEMEKEGRHHYFRLAGPHVAEALERLASIRSEHAVRSKPLSSKAKELRFARCCYNHLAGELGVALTQGLQRRGLIVATTGKQFEVTREGIEWFRGIGVDVHALKPTRRGLARQCLDWTERIHHIAGPVGEALFKTLCDNGWLLRGRGSRAVCITAKGRYELEMLLGDDSPWRVA